MEEAVILTSHWTGCCFAILHGFQTRRQEALLGKCKETIAKNKERANQLAKEKEDINFKTTGGED